MAHLEGELDKRLGRGAVSRRAQLPMGVFPLIKSAHSYHEALAHRRCPPRNGVPTD
jgi:hypothetical protein